jgi:DNA-binding SARP family transcriptional activator
MATILDSGAITREAPPPTSPMFIQDAERVVAIRLSLLDGFELRLDGTPVEVTPGGQRLLAFLAVQERPVLAEYVAACLWIDRSNELARANLRATLGQIRQAGLTLVDSAGGHLRLGPDVSVDLRDAIDGARMLLSPHGEVVDGDFEEFLMSGDVLPGWREDWVMIERERLRQLRLHALEALCRRLTAAGRLAEAIDVGLAAVAADPLRESAHRVLIQAHLTEGNRAEAVRQCEIYRGLLQNGLGVSPSALLKALMTDGLADAGPDVGHDRTPRERRKRGAQDHAAASARLDATRRRPPVDEEEAR